jgi:hypothetical protein
MLKAADHQRDYVVAIVTCQRGGTGGGFRRQRDQVVRGGKRGC